MKSRPTSRGTSKTRAGAGFSLVELMVVLVIIAIVAAVAAPTLVEVHRRNRLTDMLNLVERSASQTRNLAMQTRRAAVLEMGSGRMWINTLQGSDCWSAVNTRCVHNLGQAASENQERFIDLADPYYTDSEAYVCGVSVATMSGSSCAQDTVIQGTDSFALCYSGRGDLYLRVGDDSATACDGTGAPVAEQSDWVRACAVDPNSDNPFNGAVIYLNRFDAQPSDCTAVANDVMRGVHMPAGASPYSRVEI
jgi:prepilin-type N-terminal cleavage/methylation domain-containing protein